MENKVYDVVEGLIQKLKTTQEEMWKKQPGCLRMR